MSFLDESRSAAVPNDQRIATFRRAEDDDTGAVSFEAGDTFAQQHLRADPAGNLYGEPTTPGDDSTRPRYRTTGVTNPLAADGTFPVFERKTSSITTRECGTSETLTSVAALGLGVWVIHLVTHKYMDDALTPAFSLTPEGELTYGLNYAISPRSGISLYRDEREDGSFTGAKLELRW